MTMVASHMSHDPVAALGRPMLAIARWGLATLIGLQCATALLVASLRLVGTLDRPLKPVALVIVGFLVVVVAVATRWFWCHRSEHPRAVARGMAVLTSVAVMAIGAAVSLPGTSWEGLVAFWGLLASEEIGAWRLVRRHPSRWQSDRGPSPHPSPDSTPSVSLSREAPPACTPTSPSDAPVSPSLETAPSAMAKEVLDGPSPDMPGDDVLQQLTRRRAADGSEALVGWLRMPFAPGQRTASLHVAFCPPFAKTPQLMVEQLDGPSVRIKTAQVLPHGARFDLKLSTVADESDSVLMEFSARSDANAA